MSFLDSLENNLKSLESRGDAAPDAGRDQRRRASERARALGAAPWIEQLRKGPYTAELLRQVTRIGHSQRTKVHIAWLGDTLRLEARERKLDLRPTPEGVLAVFIENNSELRTQRLDLKGAPETLAREWLGA